MPEFGSLGEMFLVLALCCGWGALCGIFRPPGFSALTLVLAVMLFFGMTWAPNFFGHAWNAALTYGLVGGMLGFVRPQASWRAGIWLQLPEYMLVGPMNFSDSVAGMSIPQNIVVTLVHYVPLVFLPGCAGAAIGAAIARRRQFRKEPAQ